MPLYEYYCRACAGKFELLRSMAAADDDIRCPSGHTGVTRTLSMFAAVSKGSAGEASMPVGGSAAGGCACGGGGCGCGH
jgi:putative FmdB family regulatory protein